MTLTQVNDVPANTGVVLHGAQDTYSIPFAASSETAQGDLAGSALEATAYNAIAGYDIYILKINDAGDAQFMKATSGAVAAGKAYLPVAEGASVKAFDVVFAQAPTGVDEITVSKFQVSGAAIYNLAGQRVSQPTRGIYIVNGKKKTY